MSLDAGTRLGPYEIVARVGAGGMGEVYRARDTRLDRTVAIKVLPPELAADAHFRERLEREARAISALNHPNICTLHDVGRHDGGTFLVMEFLEGETLAERLSRGAMPLADALRIATQIAGALDKAHRHGIVHRDLKPGNIMLAQTGGAGPPVAKLLDFGLAKPGSAAASGVASTALASATPITAKGTILGTFQYMAPEQIEGDEADARSDIFAFGAVLFEMVTGRRAFEGKSQASLIGAILKDDPPPVSQIQPIAPPVLDYLIRTCLAKDREARFQTAHDVLLQLRWIADGGSAAGVPAPVATHRRRRERMGWVAAASLGALWVGTLAWAWPFGRIEPPPASAIRFEIPVAEASETAWPAVSPDGKLLAFVSRQQPTSQPMLTLRPMDSGTLRWIERTDRAIQPFWSPDSRSVAFFAEGKLKRIDVAGGPASTICDIPGDSLPGGGSWSRDDVVILSVARTLYRVPAAGGTPVELGRAEAGAPGWRWPSFLPDGRHFLYLSWTGQPEDRELFVGSLDKPRGRRLLATTLSAHYAPPGFIVYQQEGTLFAQPFNAGTLAFAGDATSIADGLGFNIITGRGTFSVSASGLLTYRVVGGMAVAADLLWTDQSGRPAGTSGEPGLYRQIALSPDERSLAFSRVDPVGFRIGLWTVDLPSGVTSRLTYGDASADDPIWGADSRTIVYFSSASGATDFYQQTVGSRNAAVIFKSEVFAKYPHDWSRDGRFLLFHQASGLYVLPMSGDRTPRLLREMKGAVDSGRFSPDGNWIAYGSDESGVWEIYVAPFPGFEYSRQVSSRGGVQPRWRRDSRELFFLSVDGKLMSATVTSDSRGAIATTAATERFASPISTPAANIDQYVVTGDGKRFLFIRPRAGAAPPPITVVVNWQAMLDRR